MHSMKIYKIVTDSGIEHYADAWSTERKKNHIEVFVSGKGRIKLPCKKTAEMEIDVAEKWSYAELRRLLQEYGYHVAEEYGKKHLTCCDASVPYYLVVARRANDPAFLDELLEKTGFDVFHHTNRLVCLGVYQFPLVELDDWLHKKHGYVEEEHGSMRDFCLMKWGEEFCKGLENNIGDRIEGNKECSKKDK